MRGGKTEEASNDWGVRSALRRYVIPCAVPTESSTQAEKTCLRSGPGDLNFAVLCAKKKTSECAHLGGRWQRDLACVLVQIYIGCAGLQRDVDVGLYITSNNNQSHPLLLTVARVTIRTFRNALFLPSARTINDRSVGKENSLKGNL